MTGFQPPETGNIDLTQRSFIETLARERALYPDTGVPLTVFDVASGSVRTRVGRYVAATIARFGATTADGTPTAYLPTTTVANRVETDASAVLSGFVLVNDLGAIGRDSGVYVRDLPETSVSRTEFARTLTEETVAVSEATDEGTLLYIPEESFVTAILDGLSSEA